MAPKMIPVVCASIEDESGRFLLAKRHEGKCLGGFWEFPGGKLEEGESIEAGLLRVYGPASIGKNLGLSYGMGGLVLAVDFAL